MSMLEKLGSLLKKKKKKNEIQHSYPEGSNDAQLFYCLVQVRHFREYILSFNEPTAEGPGFISAARILSLSGSHYLPLFPSFFVSRLCLFKVPQPFSSAPKQFL